MKVEFKFDNGQQVRTMLGEKGVVDTAAKDESHHLKYYVKTASHSEWYLEKDLELI